MSFNGEKIGQPGHVKLFLYLFELMNKTLPQTINDAHYDVNGILEIVSSPIRTNTHDNDEFPFRKGTRTGYGCCDYAMPQRVIILKRKKKPGTG